MLRKQAKKFPENPFQLFYHHKKEYTYKEFDQRVDEIAKGLIALGLKKGDRVGIFSPNRPEWLLTQYACARADLILVNINPSLQVDDLRYSLNHVQVKTLVMAEGYLRSNYVDIMKHIIPELGNTNANTIRSQSAPYLENIIVCGTKKHKGMINFDELYQISSIQEEYELGEREIEAKFDDITNIQYTSGTTGFPKAVALTHHNILNNGNQLGSIMNFGPDSKLLIGVPLYHCFGMVMGGLAALCHGSTLVHP